MGLFRKNREKEYEEKWQEAHDKVILFIKSRRTLDGNIIADDVAVKLLRILYNVPEKTK